jgi:uncharacterized protein (DUF1330 family)
MAAYLVFHNVVHDEAAVDAYVPKAVASMEPYGAEIIVVDGSSKVIEGSTDLPRTVIIKFESRDRAEAWYNSAEYQAILSERLNASEGFAVLVDGFEPG